MDKKIEIIELSKKYAGAKEYAIKNISLSIYKQESFAVLGQNGAGKSTLIGLITSLLIPTSGCVLIDGVAMDRRASKIKRKISLVTQHISMRKDMTVMEVMKTAAFLYGMSGREVIDKCNKLLKFVGLDEKEKVRVRKLSGGMQRKLMIARALLIEPEILILDEPTVGLDPAARRKVWDLLHSLSENGLTIILTTHYIEEAANLCNRVAFIKEGELFEVGYPDLLVKEIGEFVVDTFKNGRTKSCFFESKQEAIKYASKVDGEFKIRSANLEDVFIQKMTARVEKVNDNIFLGN